jgi:hypothetical protein
MFEEKYVLWDKDTNNFQNGSINNAKRYKKDDAQLVSMLAAMLNYDIMKIEENGKLTKVNAIS